MIKIVQVIFLTVAIAGCASVAPTSIPNIPATVTSERVVERGYTLNKEQVAFVGGSMARVKEYVLEKTSRQGSLYPSRDFSLYYPIFGPTAFVRSNELIKVVGITERNGSTYRLISLPNAPEVRLLITDDGRLEGSGLGIGDSRLGYNYRTNPSDVTFRSDKSSSVVSSVGFINFELIFSGVTKDSIRLLYREYTQQDLARPAFSQEVVYERDSQTIRFRNILIRVLDASGEQIRFVVIEDGYPKDETEKPKYGGGKMDNKTDIRSSIESNDELLKFQWPKNGVILKKFSDKNLGVDIDGTVGDPVLAARDGVVVFSSSRLNGYGNLIIIKHDDVYLTAYAHNSELLVSEGERVKQGQIIAKMGATDTDRVKLHFEIRKHGKSVDPMLYLISNELN